MEKMQRNDRLIKARLNAGYKTSADFARAHKLPEGTYRSHESGNRGLTRHTAIAYANLLGVSVEWLLTGKGPMIIQGLNESGETAGESGFVYAGIRQKTDKITPAMRRSSLTNAMKIAKEVLENKRDTVTIEEVTDLALRMLENAEKWDIEESKINAEMAEWLLTWGD